MTIRIYLIDDHAPVRTGIEMILAGEMDMEVVERFGVEIERRTTIRS